MKRILFAVAWILSAGSTAMAVSAVWTSSHTATADTAQALCAQPNSRRGILHSVCVNDSPSLTGTVIVYNSSATAVAGLAIAVIRSTAAVVSACKEFDVAVSSGLVYSTTGTNDVTINYSCY